MSTLRERMEFAPPPTPGLVRAMLLAIVAHAALLAVLAVGVQWKREATPITVEAELWSALPVEAAAPAAEEAPPEPEPPQPPEPAPVVQPPPVVAPPVPVLPPQVDIALAKEKEKAKLLKEKQLQQEKAEQEKKKLALEKQLKEKQLKEKLAKDKAEKEKQEKLARDKKQQQDQSAQKADKAKALAEAKKLEDIRQQNLKRMAGLAGSGGSGQPGSTATATQSSGPSANYSGRVAARIKPNITYIDTIVGNPTTEIEVRTSPDGTIISRRVVKASGTKSWDDAALNAIDKTAVLPRDENGRVPASLIIVLSPQVLLGR
jgi:colicin import membrane protein